MYETEQENKFKRSRYQHQDLFLLQLREIIRMQLVQRAELATAEEIPNACLRGGEVRINLSTCEGGTCHVRLPLVIAK